MESQSYGPMPGKMKLTTLAQAKAGIAAGGTAKHYRSCRRGSVTEENVVLRETERRGIIVYNGSA